MQVALVAINTWQISHGKMVGAIVVGFLISLVWTLNVSKAAFACWRTRLIYCSGASAGTLGGILIAKLIYHT
jgi:hypothetical protein